MRSNRILKSAIALALAGVSGLALAQQPPANTTILETVVVTGSYIRGTAEDAALPVSVITSEDLAKQGSPSTLEMIKNLSASAGVLGDTNQFDARGAQGTEGSGTVNLRGLGPQRTLVLLNGRRMVNNPLTGAVDTNTLPMFAIGRVEVLKDGAAATYGSDAIAGVVNFITKKKLEGFDVSASYDHIAGSSGDYDAGGSFGWQGTDSDFMVSLGYEHRSELKVTDRDWAHVPYASNPDGGWSGAGNPEGYVLSPFNKGVIDPSCGAIGGVPSITAGFIPGCVWQYTVFDNLVEEQNRYQAYAEFNLRFGNSAEWHTEALYAKTDVPHYKTSPSYLMTQAPTAASLPTGVPAIGFYYVPAGNPGIQQYIAANPTITTVTGGVVSTSPVGAQLNGGVFLRTLLFRPFAIGGNPLFGYSSSEAKRVYDTLHFSTGVKGDFNESVSYDVAVTYTSEKIARDARDTVVDRYQLALLGLGGPNCSPTTGTPGVGSCSYINPFGNAVPSNVVTGVANPQFNSGSIGGLPIPNNNIDLINWFFPKYEGSNKETQSVVDAVLNGKTGLSLPGGDVGWALGTQYRSIKYNQQVADINNLDINPCVDSVDFPAVPCNPPGSASPTKSYGAGVFTFLGGGHNLDLSQKVYAFFGELSLPIFSSLQGQLAARYERYDQGVGATFNPKLALRWQLNDVFALRGSVGSTFRGPPAQTLIAGSFTSLQNIFSSFRAVDTFGNPNLKPETALNYNVGFIIKDEGFSSTIDYWNFRFDKPIVIEPLVNIVNTVFPTAASIANCGTALAQRFTFTGPCTSANISRVRVNYVNGPTTKTSGIDLDAKYRWDQVLGGELTSGLDATYIIKYVQEAMSVEGTQVQPEIDAVGYFNSQTTAYPLPKWRGSIFGNYSVGDHNVRLVMNYVNGYDDQRLGLFAAGSYPLLGATTAVTAGQHIPSWVTWDAHYNLSLPWNTTLTFTVNNITDRNPPFVRAELNYDTFTANPLGRTYKLSVNSKF